MQSGSTEPTYEHPPAARGPGAARRARGVRDEIDRELRLPGAGAGSDRRPRAADAPPVIIVMPGTFETSGGVGRQVQYITQALAQHHPDVRWRLVTSRGGGSVASSLWRVPMAMAHILALRLRYGRTVVHVHMSSYASTARKYFVASWARLLGLPTIIHVHGAMFHVFYRGLHPFLQRRVRHLLQRSVTVIALGRRWAEFFREEVGLTGSITVVPNGVPDPLGGANAVSRDDRRSEPSILFLGRVEARKGVPELLDALGAVSDLPWTATLAGDGDVEGFRAQAARNGIASRVRFPGWVGGAESFAMRAAADVLVLPSHHEGLPLAVLEAMACGLPVVATPVGATADAVLDHETGLLVPPGEPRPLADALRFMLENPAARRRMGEAGRRRFREKFDIRATVTSLVDLYERAR